MRIYASNYIDNATVTTSSSDTNQSVDSLKYPQLANTFTFAGDTNESVTIDLGLSLSIKTFIVDRGNLTSSATVTLEANTSNSWVSPAYSVSLDQSDSCYFKDLDQNYRWWRLVVSDLGVNKISLGYITIGDAYTQMPGIDPAATLTYNTTSQRSVSVSGQLFGNRGYQYLETTFTFPQFDDEKRQELLGLWSSIENVTPVWVMLWANNLDEFPPIFAVLKNNTVTFDKKEYKYYSTDLTVRQVF